MSMGYHELRAGLPHCRRFAVDIGLEHAVSGGTVSMRCGYMEKGKRVEVPIIPASSVTVKIAASGTGVLGFEVEPDPASAPLTIQEITLSPFTCQMKTACTSTNIYPNIRFRMADGSIRTEHPKELAEAILLLSDGWVNPAIQPTTPEELRARCAIFNQLFFRFGIPEMIDRESVEMLLQYSGLGHRPQAEGKDPG